MIPLISHPTKVDRQPRRKIVPCTSNFQGFGLFILPFQMAYLCMTQQFAARWVVAAINEMTAALLDTRTASGDRTILFQKVYSAEAAMPSQSSAGLAAGMSTAISQLSRSLIGDLYGALAGYEHECSFRAPEQ